LNKSQT